MLRITDRHWIARRIYPHELLDLHGEVTGRRFRCTRRTAYVMGWTPFLFGIMPAGLALGLPGASGPYVALAVICATIIIVGLWLGQSMQDGLDLFLYWLGFSTLPAPFVCFFFYSEPYPAGLIAMGVYVVASLLVLGSAALSFNFEILTPPWACQHCGYDLSRLKTRTCPECGKPVEPRR